MTKKPTFKRKIRIAFKLQQIIKLLRQKLLDAFRKRMQRARKFSLINARKICSREIDPKTGHPYIEELPSEVLYPLPTPHNYATASGWRFVHARMHSLHFIVVLSQRFQLAPPQPRHPFTGRWKSGGHFLSSPAITISPLEVDGGGGWKGEEQRD